MIGNVIRVYHDEVGHVGAQKTMEGILNTSWFPSMKQRVYEHIQNCVKCLVANCSSERSEGELQIVEKGTTPFKTLHVDHFGPLEKTQESFRHVLVVVDAFTKFSWLFATKSTGFQEVIDHLSVLNGMFGTPKQIVSDRGTAFTSQAFSEFLKKLNVKHRQIAVASL